MMKSASLGYALFNVETASGGQNLVYEVHQGKGFANPMMRQVKSVSSTTGVLGSLDVTKKPGSAGIDRTGKNFTPKTKREIDAENAAQNGGVNRCTNCGIETVPGKRHQSGVTPPGNERHRDHIIPKAKGGDGTLENGQILCRTCNLNKRDKL